MSEPNDRMHTRRRGFLKVMGIGSAAMLTGSSLADETVAVDQPAQLPQIQIGQHSFSRLICGANPFNGGSHLSTFLNRAMKDYYTPTQIKHTLLRCREVGINTWQSGLGQVELYRQFVQAGLDMQFMAIAAGDHAHIDRLKEGGCIAIAHHGEVTDHLFKTDQLDKAREFTKAVRDAGLLVGVSTHMPQVIDAIESSDWDVDYYMCCVYERHRSKSQLEEMLGQAPIPVGEVYLPDDPPRMFRVMRQTSRPCLAFKILAAGRLSDRKQWVEQAFRDTLSSIKPSDGIIVGIYDRYSDQPAECADYVRRFSKSTS